MIIADEIYNNDYSDEINEYFFISDRKQMNKKNHSIKLEPCLIFNPSEAAMNLLAD